MTTDTAEKPKTKRKYNRINPHPTPKVPIKKVTDLLANRKLSVQDAAKILNCSPGSIYSALNRNDINISAYDLDAIKNNEESELAIITHHARHHLYKLLIAGKLKAIETTAVLDRCFQQRRELQGKGHSSINIFTLIVKKADDNILNVPTTSCTTVQPNQPIVQQEANSTIGCQDNVT